MSTPEPQRIQFYTCFTRTAFLHFEDSLDLGKIRLFAGKFKRGSGMGQGAYHFLDVADARPVLMDISWGRPVQFKDYKGGSGSGGVISRVLSIKTQDDTVWIEIKNGPGKKTKTGAVEPAGEATSAVAIPIKIPDARRMALAVLSYIAAQEAARAVIALIGAGPVSASYGSAGPVRVILPDALDPEHEQPSLHPKVPARDEERVGDPGMSPGFLVDEGIVKNEETGRQLMDTLGIKDGDPTRESKKRIKLFFEWRSVPGFDGMDQESRLRAAGKAILGELPPEPEKVR